MKEVSKNVKAFLKTGEKVEAVLTGNSYTSSSSVIIRFLAAIVRLVALILGCPTRKSVVCTNKRLITEDNTKILYFFDYSSSIVAIAPQILLIVSNILHIVPINHHLYYYLLTFKSL